MWQTDSKTTGFNSRYSLKKIVEGFLILVGFSLFIHLMTSRNIGSKGIYLSFVIVILYPAAAAYCHIRKIGSAARLLAMLSAMGVGFWLFNLFRYSGFVEWPLGNASDLVSYSWLLYYHLVLSVTVLTLVILTWRLLFNGKTVPWGRWEIPSFPIYSRSGLIFIAVCLWTYSFFMMWRTEIHASGPMAGFVAVCLIKAFLTGATEEFCYRGVVQAAAIERYGVTAGILFQSILYAAFHFHLGAVVFTGWLFPAGVMLLGVFLGVVTYHTSGISWACTIHTGIDVVIEWLNLALT